MYKVLIGSPVKQKPHILECFLASLNKLNHNDLHITYYFIDDNDEKQSSQLLKKFLLDNKKHGFMEKVQLGDHFIRDDVTHHWTNELIKRVANHKNRIIKYTLDNHFDYLFLIDSDLVLHPNTLIQLLNAKRDIICEIFWTKWKPDLPELPQVWGCDQYTLAEIAPGEKITPEDALYRQRKWINNLRNPGVYRVGGLGACTLISRKVLEKGVDFSPLYNVSFWGEDRHFCIRAVALGFELFVDTHYPAFHIYRESDIPKAHEFLLKHNNVFTSEKQISRDKQILELTRKALIAYGTTNYYKKDIQSGLEVFALDIRDIIYQERYKLYKQIKKGLCITYTDVLDLSIKERGKDKALVFARIKNYGVIQRSNFKNEFQAIVHLQRDTQKWLVTGIDFQPIKENRFQGLNGSFWRSGRIAKSTGNRITLSMIVKNEADRYLRLVLEQVRCFIDDAVIIDDGSTDSTPDLIKEVLKDIPLKLIRNKEPLFGVNESKLRQILWNETIQTKPDWILSLDADELFEARASNEIRKMVNQEDFDYYAFRLYDFWNENYYREDSLWSAHNRYFVLLLRYQPYFNYYWNQTPLHCGRFPANINLLPGIQSSLRVKHLGWMNPYDRLKKYLRYKELDPEGKWGIKEQYESILDPAPHLVRWKERL